MLIDTLLFLYERDLNRLKNEISSYPTEIALWVVRSQINNSAGNLCLHLIGNLNTYIGTVLGNSGYVRNREAEFSLKNIPLSELLTKIDATRAMIQQTLPRLTPTALTQEYPQPVFDYPMTTEFFLVHLATHLTYHLGQINYHRRLV